MHRCDFSWNKTEYQFTFFANSDIYKKGVDYNKNNGIYFLEKNWCYVYQAFKELYFAAGVPFDDSEGSNIPKDLTELNAGSSNGSTIIPRNITRENAFVKIPERVYMGCLTEFSRNGIVFEMMGTGKNTFHDNTFSVNGKIWKSGIDLSECKDFENLQKKWDSVYQGLKSAFDEHNCIFSPSEPIPIKPTSTVFEKYFCLFDELKLINVERFNGAPGFETLASFRGFTGNTKDVLLSLKSYCNYFIIAGVYLADQMNTKFRNIKTNHPIEL